MRGISRGTGAVYSLFRSLDELAAQRRVCTPGNTLSFLTARLATRPWQLRLLYTILSEWNGRQIIGTVNRTPERTLRKRKACKLGAESTRLFFSVTLITTHLSRFYLHTYYAGTSRWWNQYT